MSQDHYSTKRKRRPKNKKRKDYTAATMLKLRDLSADPGSMLTVADLRKFVDILKKHPRQPDENDNYVFKSTVA